ncbi:50S ribosomal protein L9 [Robiginitomaculum antarcticum]|uniref:50S ribosomal protein L9 n=1 Tax=Robiginitomaculum antarcticum TaxID=437507 RepID=UPI00036E4427|nr:50S ribosomal protein L9 [Robiginitomaculum antarcticum]
MQVILLERVDNLGAMGEVVSVKPGFARNFLLPNEKALRATDGNMARFEAQREVLEKRNAENAEKARNEGGGIDGQSFVVIRKAGETGMLYGSVTARDIAEIVGHNVSRSMVKLEQPIKALGVTPVRIKLHPEVEVNVEINVARTEEEAERQAKGEDVIATQMDDDRAQAEDAISERGEINAEMFEEEALAAQAAEDLGAPKGEEEE